MTIRKMLYLVALFAAPMVVAAQSPVNGFMQGKGNGSVVLSYATETYDKVFLVPEEIDGVPVFNEVQKSSVSLYASYGITDKLDVALNAPYITSKGSATDATLTDLNFTNEIKGIQDLSLHLKYSAVTIDFGGSNLSLLATAGVQTPIGDYKVDEGLQSIIAIGNRSTSINAIAAAHFKMDSGVFATAQGGYSFRSNDVPNAFISEFKAGYAGSSFYVDAYVAGQLSSKDAPDILQEGFVGVFPVTRVNYTRVGLNVFVPIVSSFGVAGGGSTYVAGRNLGKSTAFYGGLVFSF